MWYPEMCLISVVIPTYNRERFITKAVDSVLRQKVSDWELIVVDDGSTDGTRQALAPYADRLTYLRQSNSGVSAARNAGVREARGRWVAFLDSDDEWTEEYLSAQVAHIQAFPDSVAHVANSVTVLPDGSRTGHFAEIGLIRRFQPEPILRVERPLGVILGHAHWFLQASIMRRDLLVKAGLFNTDLSIAEDLDVFARVSLEGPFTFCKEELVEIHRRQESIENLSARSVRRGINRYRSFGKVYANLLRHEKLNTPERSIVTEALSRNRRALGNVLIMAGNNLEARKSYKESLCLYPSVQSTVKFLATFLPTEVSRALVIKGKHILPGDDSLS
jgi:glycosyltransferase involved in cell wall biosynthesis